MQKRSECPSKILNCQNIEEVFQEIQLFGGDCLSKTLIVFDLDWTLVKPVTKAARFTSIKAHKDLFEELVKDFSNEQKEEIVNLALVASKHDPMEPETLSFFSKIKDAGFFTIALTATLSGPIGSVSNFKDYRFRELESLGFQFHQGFSAESEFCLRDLPKFREDHPVYYKGIIFGNCVRYQNTKGDVLNSFLQKVGFFPDRVVFIDDDEKNVQDMNDYLNKVGIQGRSIRYTQREKHPEELVSAQEFLSFWHPLAEEVKSVNKA